MAQEPTQMKPSEPESAEAKLREHGLRVLARIIARKHLHDVQPGGEPEDKPIARAQGSSTWGNQRRPRKRLTQAIEEKNNG